jgi:hypothetical protein
MRGLEENIWNVFAPASTARWAAVQQPPAVPKWTPIRRAAAFGGEVLSVALAGEMLASTRFATLSMLRAYRSLRSSGQERAGLRLRRSTLTVSGSMYHRDALQPHGKTVAQGCAI